MSKDMGAKTLLAYTKDLGYEGAELEVIPL